MSHVSSESDRFAGTTSGYPWLPIVLVLGVPNIWLFSGGFQMFQPAGWVDPGIYLGYFIGLSERIERFGANYFSMRLPFTAVGAALYAVFLPEIAARAFVAVFNSLAAISVFILVARRAGPAAGVLASWWLTLNPLWVAAIARGYVDGPAMAYLLAALALLINRDSWERRNLAVMAGGVFAALAVFTHPIMVLMFFFAAVAECAVSRPRLIAVLKDIGWLALGALAATLALGAVSVMVKGKFLFFLADPHAFSRSFDGFGANYRYELREWVPNAYRLAPPIALLALGLLLLFFDRIGKSSTLAAAGVAMTGGIGAFLVYWDYVVGGATLQSSFYSSYMIAGQALIVGAAAGLAMRHANHQLMHAALVGAGLGILALAVFTRADLLWVRVQDRDPNGILAWLAIAGAFALAIALLFSRLRVLGVAGLIATTMLAGVLNHDTRRTFVTRSGIDFATTFRSTMKVADFVADHVTSNERLLFWYRRDELTERELPRRHYALYDLRFRETRFVLNYWDSLVALWLWDRTSLGWTMPVLTPDELVRLRRFDVPTSVVTLCLEAAECEAAVDALAGYGYDVLEHARTRIDTGYVPFDAVLYKLTKLPDA